MTSKRIWHIARLRDGTRQIGMLLVIFVLCVGGCTSHLQAQAVAFIRQFGTADYRGLLGCSCGRQHICRWGNFVTHKVANGADNAMPSCDSTALRALGNGLARLTTDLAFVRGPLM